MAELAQLTEALKGLTEDEKAEVLKSLGAPEPIDVRGELEKLLAEKAVVEDTERKAAEAEEQKAIEKARAAITPDMRPGPMTEDADHRPGEEVKTFAIGGHRPLLRVKDARDLLFAKEKEVPDSSKSAVKELHRWNDEMLLRSRLLHQNGVPQSARRLTGYSDVFESKAWRSDMEKAALYSTGTGVGDEWVPTMFSGTWMELAAEQAVLMSLFRSVDMPSNPCLYPVFGNRTATAYLAGEAAIDNAAAYTATNITTAQLSLSAKQIALRVPYSQELIEDAIAGTLDYAQRDLQQSAAYYVDLAILNGDTSATHEDTGGSYAANSVYRAFDGLRHYSLVTDTTANQSCNGLTWTTANKLLAGLAAMGKFAGPNPVGICSRDLGRKLTMLENRSGYLVNNLGRQPEAAAEAPIQSLSLFGARIVPSDAMSDDLNASGIYDNSTATFTSLLWVNPEAFYVGTRRGWTLEIEKDILAGQWNMVLTTRIAFNTPYTTGEITSNCYAIPDSW